MFAGCWSARISFACSTKELAIRALFLGLLGPVRRLDGERFEAGALGVGVGEGVGEALAPEDGDGPVLLLVHHEDLDAVELQVLVQELDELLAFLGGMRPALRSEILPSSSLVAKLTRAARSLSPRSKPTPRALRTPRPTWKRKGS